MTEHALEEAIRMLKTRGGRFVRTSSRGHSIWRLGKTQVVVNDGHRPSDARSIPNTIAEIKRVCARWDRENPTPPAEQSQGPPAGGVPLEVLTGLAEDRHAHNGQTPTSSTPTAAAAAAVVASSFQPPEWRCSECDYVTTSERALHGHRSRHAQRPLSVCPKCGISMQTVWMKRHIGSAMCERLQVGKPAEPKPAEPKRTPVRAEPRLTVEDEQGIEELIARLRKVLLGLMLERDDARRQATELTEKLKVIKTALITSGGGHP